MNNFARDNGDWNQGLDDRRDLERERQERAEEVTPPAMRRYDADPIDYYDEDQFGDDAVCPVCTCRMSIVDPTTCQNCDYQTDWTAEQIDAYRATLGGPITDEVSEGESDHDGDYGYEKAQWADRKAA